MATGSGAALGSTIALPVFDFYSLLLAALAEFSFGPVDDVIES